MSHRIYKCWCCDCQRYTQKPVTLTLRSLHKAYLTWKRFPHYCLFLGEYTGDCWILISTNSNSELWWFLISLNKITISRIDGDMRYPDTHVSPLWFWLMKWYYFHRYQTYFLDKIMRAKSLKCNWPCSTEYKVGIIKRLKTFCVTQPRHILISRLQFKRTGEYMRCIWLIGTVCRVRDKVSHIIWLQLAFTEITISNSIGISFI